MRILYYDCFAGISGDMNLAALLDLGVPQEHLIAELDKLRLPGWSLRITPDAKNGIGGTRVDVDLIADTQKSPARFRHTTSMHSHGGIAHSHEHSQLEQAHHHAHEHSHEHRNYQDIIALIKASTLAEDTKALSLNIFERVAKAESKVHGVSLAEVGFHEVGAVDSIIDIVGAAICINWFKPDLILSSAPELGGGTVSCAHGRLPVPAPATVEILAGIPVRTGAVPFEMTTPTGAAILATVVNRFSESERLTISRTGYGIGHRTVAIPNILRVHLAEQTDVPNGTIFESLGECTAATILECNIDDMSGEILGSLLETLLAAGASDVWHTPIVMKKSRPAYTLSVLCDSAKAATLAELILRHTSSFGLRYHQVGKLALKRTMSNFQSSLGMVPVKSAVINGQVIKAKPEYEDCRRIAQACGRPLREVINIIQGELDGQ